MGPQIREIIDQNPDQSIRLIRSKLQVIRKESNDSDDAEDSGTIVEDIVVPDGDVIDKSEIIQALDDQGTNTSARVENITGYTTEDGINHITFDLKIVKST